MTRAKGQAKVERKAEALEVLEITYVPTDEVHPNTWNPNRESDHDFELLKRSIREDGFTQPIVAVRATPELKAEDPALDRYPDSAVVVVDGEHRWRAAGDLGLTRVPVALVPMGLTQARLATLRHNRARGSEDIELAADLLRDLQALGAAEWAMDGLLMDDAEFNKLVEDVPAPQALAGEDWSEAWAPVKADSADQADRTSGPPPDGRVVSATRAASDLERDRERAVREAKTSEERQAIRRDRSVFRIVLSFAGEEGELVKTVLGDRPADRVVELCRSATEG